MARIIRNGSSLKVMSGSRGVFIIRLSRSLRPSNGSTNFPYCSLLRQKAMALMVKSRRFWSSSRVPSSTIGFRESWLYDSFLAPTNSISYPLCFICAVPKFLKTVIFVFFPPSFFSYQLSQFNSFSHCHNIYIVRWAEEKKNLVRILRLNSTPAPFHLQHLK